MTEVLTCALTGLLFIFKKQCAIVFLAQGVTTCFLCVVKYLKMLSIFDKIKLCCH